MKIEKHKFLPVWNVMKHNGTRYEAVWSCYTEKGALKKLNELKK